MCGLWATHAPTINHRERVSRGCALPVTLKKCCARSTVLGSEQHPIRSAQLMAPSGRHGSLVVSIRDLRVIHVSPGGRKRLQARRVLRAVAGPRAIALLAAAFVLAAPALASRHRRSDISPTRVAGLQTGSRPFTEVAAKVPWTGIAGPLRVSRTNPRYFTNNTGRAVYLTGSHTWPNFQDGGATDPPKRFAWTGYLDILQRHHLNVIKLWRFEQAKFSSETPGDFYLEPSPYLRTGPGVALDGKPKFDLRRFNPAYFDRMRRRIIEARDRGIYVSIMLFDGWSIERKMNKPVGNPWLGHPFNAANNINGVDGDTNHDNAGAESHTLASQTVTTFQEGYVRKVIDVVNDLDNVLYEISNEDRATTAALAWQYHMIDFIHQYESRKRKQHPVGMTSLWPGGSNTWLYSSKADWIAPNGSLRETPTATGTKVVLNDTDHLCGVCGDAAWVWKSFTRGTNPILMDPFDGTWPIASVPYDVTDRRWNAVRTNMGYARSFADRMDLLEMRPRGELASSGYCLANPAGTHPEYLVYLPSGGAVTINLRGSSGPLSVDWFLPISGQTVRAPGITGGVSLRLSAPSAPDAVLYIHR